MKRFKKKHTKIPRPAAVMRLLRQIDPELYARYVRALAGTPDILPLPIRVATLAEFDPCKRQNIRYYPDLHNFQIYDMPNRSLPVGKFLALFRSFLDPTELDKLEADLTNYRLEFHTDAQKWVDTYADETIDSCMTGCGIVACYAHPQNKLALAALYAPGTNQVIARTIVNTDEKWYVRLFGDPLLVEKLREQGYSKLTRVPRAFRMYGHAGPLLVPGDISYPYFDFSCSDIEVLTQTHNPDTGYVEVIVNSGNT